jgi:hypothetical protein
MYSSPSNSSDLRPCVRMCSFILRTSGSLLQGKLPQGKLLHVYGCHIMRKRACARTHTQTPAAIEMKQGPHQRFNIITFTKSLLHVDRDGHVAQRSISILPMSAPLLVRCSCMIQKSSDECFLFQCWEEALILINHSTCHIAMGIL